MPTTLMTPGLFGLYLNFRFQPAFIILKNETVFYYKGTTAVLSKFKGKPNVIPEICGACGVDYWVSFLKKIGEIADKTSVSLQFFCDDG